MASIGKAFQRGPRRAGVGMPGSMREAANPPPQMSESVLLTHLCTEAQGQQENLALTTGTDETGVALPGGGTGNATSRRPRSSRL